MTQFQDGPAAGKCLMLKRSPRFLRVAIDQRGIDALDQPDDEPAANEHLFAYELVGEPGWCHVRRRGGGGMYSVATYRFIPDQPSEAIMRDRNQWIGWATERIP